MRRLLLALALLLGLTGAAPAAELKLVSQGPVRGGWEYIVRSPSAGRDFRIQVAEPDRLPWQRSRLPAIYVLDGDAFFGRARSAAINLADQRKMSRAYVVGVGYPRGTDVKWQRLDDLVHVKAGHAGRTVGGGGETFQTFLLDELRPFIEARYPVERERSVLAGHSVGGLFATAVLATRPDAFGGYLIGSPSLQFGGWLKTPIEAAEGKGARVFVAVGANEGGMIPMAEALGKFLGEPGRGFVVQQQTVAGAGHMGVVSPMFWGGLPFVLPAKKP